MAKYGILLLVIGIIWQVFISQYYSESASERARLRCVDCRKSWEIGYGKISAWHWIGVKDFPPPQICPFCGSVHTTRSGTDVIITPGNAVACQLFASAWLMMAGGVLLLFDLSVRMGFWRREGLQRQV